MIDELVRMSRRFGADPTFVLAGGGNTSVKHGNRLWVKSSGHALATIDQHGFVELDRDALDAMLLADWPSDMMARESLFIERIMAARVHPALNQRPSVEALLHHLIADRFVVHTHPGVVNALTCCRDGKTLAAKWLGDSVLWQDYVDPGLVLAQSLQRSLAACQHRPPAILLANHGLIVSGEDADSIELKSQRLLRQIHQQLESSPPFAWNGGRYPEQPQRIETYAQAMSRLQPGGAIAIDTSDSIKRLVGSRQGRDVALAGPLTPDQIVYCRSLPMWIDDPVLTVESAHEQLDAAMKTYRQSHGFDPWIALIAGVGMMAVRESSKLAEVSRSIFADAAGIYHDAERFGGCHPMTLRDQEFIERWEVEAYRRSVMAGK